MFIIKMGGGLGNQMYQYAFAMMLLKIYPSMEIQYDISEYEINNEHFGFDFINYFELKSDITEISNNELKLIKPIYYFIKKTRLSFLFSGNIYFRKLINMVERLLYRIRKRPYILITDLQASTFNSGVFHLSINKEKKHWYFSGNWQNIGYYNMDLQYIKDSFIFKNSLLGTALQLSYFMESEESVCVHVRRGDYVNNERFNLCDEKYYENAINFLLELTNTTIEKLHFYFFTDDVDYVQQKYRQIPKKIVSHPKECGIDLQLMTKCKYYIIANSTFSFWGAYLSKNPQKIVIAPKYVYRLNHMIYEFSLPQDWYTIENSLEEER